MHKLFAKFLYPLKVSSPIFCHTSNKHLHEILKYKQKQHYLKN